MSSLFSFFFQLLLLEMSDNLFNIQTVTNLDLMILLYKMMKFKSIQEVNIKATHAFSNPCIFASVASGSVTVKVDVDDCFVYIYNSHSAGRTARRSVSLVCRDTYWFMLNTTLHVAQLHQMKTSHRSRLRCF